MRELVKATFSQGDALVARALHPGACGAIRETGETAAADLPESARDDAPRYLSLPHERADQGYACSSLANMRHVPGMSRNP